MATFLQFFTPNSIVSYLFQTRSSRFHTIPAQIGLNFILFFFNILLLFVKCFLNLHPNESFSYIYHKKGRLHLLLLRQGSSWECALRESENRPLTHSSSLHPVGRAVTTGHELFGHGRSLALGRFNSQHVDAIQTENLIRRVMGITSINDGSNHANREYISNPTSLPEHR